MLGNDDAFSTLATLPNLVRLDLSDDAFMVGVLELPKGGFPRLRLLLFDALSKSTEWRVEEGTMPCLGELRLCGCRNMRTLLEGLRGLTKDRLVILEMDVIKGRIEKDIGEDYHKIQHVHCIETDSV
ncbi:disease resistance RPP8-like protein 3 [Musa acuminata AAA Group]|uniref:disease resistance RPP8-like protein 3 n=1 Tax=Musa acuminata AAA Group TaxID=214697 RepID=UPI0031D1EB3A